MPDNTSFWRNDESKSYAEMHIHYIYLILNIFCIMATCNAFHCFIIYETRCATRMIFFRIYGLR
ncbi:hypothetical protein KL86DPRO_10558 [uncultured delta proteobacterium]|uniref:Uncharacterized protein n=1 Tax=uncultured delta proteobacterium TaxID=34034 RepID=A0A212J281_9DELT|nr:hypothetical protein KL86DPRO_10558 [uncultured delta proteobacterium]